MTTTVTAADNAPKVLISQAGRKGDPGTDGTNGDGFNQVRKSLLDNPLCHLFKTNKLVDTSAPTNTDADVTWNRSTSATYVDRYGIVKTAAINTPREEKEGFLIEGASTNIIVYSEQFDNAAWSKNTVTVTANNVAAPNGTMTADKIVGTGADSYIHQSFAATSILSTASIWLRADVPTSVNLYFIGGIPQGESISITTEWQRFEINSIDVSNNTLLIGGGGTFTAGETIYAWGAQIEQLPFASSYIPTVATPITRTADLVTVLPTNNISLLNLDNTISFTCDTIGNNAPFNQAIITSVATNTFSRTLVFWGGSDVVVLDYLSGFPYSYFATQEDTNNIVSSYNAGSLISYVNGAQVFNSAAPYTDLAISSSLIIGSSGTTQFLFGHIKDLKIYDFALNANEAEYLSA